LEQKSNESHALMSGVKHGEWLLRMPQTNANVDNKVKSNQ